MAEQADREAEDRSLLSRTAERRENQRVEAEWFALATKLTAIKRGQLAELGLGEPELGIIEEISVISDPAARNRAIKRLRAALRDMDLRTFAERLTRVTDPQRRRDPSAEEVWANRLVSDGDRALLSFLELHPGADRAQLRTLVRNARSAKPAEQKRATQRLTQVVQRAIAGSSAQATEEHAQPEDSS